jgi:hypothetical protein
MEDNRARSYNLHVDVHRSGEHFDRCEVHHAGVMVSLTFSPAGYSARLSSVTRLPKYPAIVSARGGGRSRRIVSRLRLWPSRIVHDYSHTYWSRRSGATKWQSHCRALGRTAGTCIRARHRDQRCAVRCRPNAAVNRLDHGELGMVRSSVDWVCMQIAKSIFPMSGRRPLFNACEAIVPVRNAERARTVH